MASYFTCAAARHARKEAQKEANQLFRNLRRKCPKREEAVRVIYPRRFPLGECIVAVLAPIDIESMQIFGKFCRAHAHYRYPPVVTSDGYGRWLRLVWRFPEVSCHDATKLLQIAVKIAKWAEEMFARKAIVYPEDGIVATRIKLSLE